MSRLIDADALRERMYHDAFEMDSDMQKWDGGCWIRYKMFENAIDDAPTVEPQQWIPVTEEEVFQAGYEGREILFRVNGRLFAIRELAQ